MINKHNSIKYWLLTTEFPPFYGGGISTYCFHTAQMLAANGYEVTVFVADDSVEGIKETVQNAITVIRFDSGQADTRASLNVTAKRSLAFAQVIKRYVEKTGRPDLIEAQDYQGIAYYLLQFKLTLDKELKDIPVLITLHSPAFVYLEYNKVPTYKFPDFWTCEMEKHVIHAANHLIAPSKYITDVILDYMPLQTAYTVVANPYANDRLPIEQMPLKKGKVVYYGKLSPQKGTFELLAYSKDLWDEGYEFTLHIVGGTDIVYHIETRTMGSLLKEQYASYIESGVLVMHGDVDPGSLQEAVSDAQLVVIPSIVDNLPYAVIEMMEIGKVVLASKQGGQSEIIEDGVTGFLFDHSISNDFKEKLLSILDKKTEELLAIGDLARKAVLQKYAYETIFPIKDVLIRETITAYSKVSDSFPFLHQEAFTDLPINGERALLSIVIPYYNMGALVLEAIDSVLASTYQNIEVLVVDDGSNDSHSKKVLEQLDRKGKVKLLVKKNTGLADTRNWGAVQAKGEYLAFLDADDKVAPLYYEKAIAVLKKYNNVFFVGAWTQYFGDSHKVWPTFTPQPPYLLIHNSVNSSALVYKKAAYLTSGLNKTALQFGLEDYESVISMMEKGYNGVVLPQVYFFYRVRKGSMFRKLNTNKFLYSYKYIADKHVSYYNKFALPVIHLLNSNGPGFYYDNPTEEVVVSARIKQRSKTTEKLIAIVKRNGYLKELALFILRKVK